MANSEIGLIGLGTMGAALSLTLMVMVLVALIYYTKISSGEQKHHE